MIDGGIIELNAQISTPVFHLISCEIRTVIGDDAVGDAVMVYDPGYKVYHRSRFDRFNWFGFYLFGEFMHHDQQVFLLMDSSFKGSDHIEPPDREVASYGDCLESGR